MYEVKDLRLHMVYIGSGRLKKYSGAITPKLMLLIKKFKGNVLIAPC